MDQCHSCHLHEEDVEVMECCGAQICGGCRGQCCEEAE